jgi:hypothetical protein
VIELSVSTGFKRLANPLKSVGAKETRGTGMDLYSYLQKLGEVRSVS